MINYANPFKEKAPDRPAYFCNNFKGSSALLGIGSIVRSLKVLVIQPIYGLMSNKLRWIILFSHRLKA